jgi:hypothetical protein
MHSLRVIYLGRLDTEAPSFQEDRLMMPHERGEHEVRMAGGKLDLCLKFHAAGRFVHRGLRGDLSGRRKSGCLCVNVARQDPKLTVSCRIWWVNDPPLSLLHVFALAGLVGGGSMLREGQAERWLYVRFGRVLADGSAFHAAQFNQVRGSCFFGYMLKTYRARPTSAAGPWMQGLIGKVRRRSRDQEANPMLINKPQSSGNVCKV